MLHALSFMYVDCNAHSELLSIIYFCCSNAFESLLRMIIGLISSNDELKEQAKKLSTHPTSSVNFPYMTTDDAESEMKSNSRKRKYKKLFLEGQKDGWHSCSKKPRCCSPPTQPLKKEKSDIGVYIQDTNCVEIPLLLFEFVEDEDESGSYIKAFNKLARKAAYSLTFLPTVFGVIVKDLAVYLYEFDRVPKESCVDVRETRCLIRGKEFIPKSIGSDLVNLVQKITKCILYVFVECLPEVSPSGNTHPERDAVSLNSLCSKCWNIGDRAEPGSTPGSTT